jgi:prepilin-type N-terminal cleavage/methylation domain-containing protein
MPPRSIATHHPRPATRGFTLAEVVVALTLLAWGALVAVAATASAVRAVGSAESQGAATAAARNRLEHVAALPCADLASGSATDVARGIREWWTVTRGRNGARLVTDSVVYSDRGAMRALVLHRLIAC